MPSGRRRRPTALQTLATLVVAGISPAGATDVDPANLGAPCCADLDQRIADLEETVARKGNRRVTLEISGVVNSAVMSWDDGGSGTPTSSPTTTSVRASASSGRRQSMRSGRRGTPSMSASGRPTPNWSINLTTAASAVVAKKVRPAQLRLVSAQQAIRNRLRRHHLCSHRPDRQLQRHADRHVRSIRRAGERGPRHVPALCARWAPYRQPAQLAAHHRCRRRPAG